MPENKTKNKIIGIDARLYGPVGKGLGRYTQELVDNLLELDRENRYVIFLRRDNFDLLAVDGVRVRKVLADARWYTLAEQLTLPWLIARERIDLMHFPHFNVPIFCPAAFVVTIHDLILLNFPTARASTLGPVLYKIKNAGYRLVISRAVSRAKKIFAVSQFTKDDLVRHFKIDAEKVLVTYEGVADFDKAAAGDSPEAGEKLLGRLGIKKKFLLYVGNAYPHKNLDGLLRIFSELIKKRPELQLVLVGKDDYFYERLKTLATKLGLWRPDAAGPVVFAGYLPDRELKLLYSLSLAYVFPSFFEGFGLPPLEAMAAGLPVASSDRTSLPEILGPAALYFDPDDREQFLSALERISEDQALRFELVRAGREQVKKYSWRECARQTLEIYNQLLK